MSKPIVTIALSDDGNSVFVYAGGISTDESSADVVGHTVRTVNLTDTLELECVLGLQREDFDFQLHEWVSGLTRKAVASDG